MIKLLIKNILSLVGYEILRKSKFTPLLEKYIKENIKDFDFVQIGAFDGIEDDLFSRIIRQYDLRGVLVEPQIEFFSNLKKNFSDCTQLVFENVAISDKNEKRLFYSFRPEARKKFYRAPLMASFSLEVISSHCKDFPEYKDYLVSNEIKCLCLSSLFKKHELKKLDLLIIDTEGFDFEIIKQLKDCSIKPKFILYEHIHLNQKERKSCKKFLQKCGYIVNRDSHPNTFARLKQDFCNLINMN